MRTFWAVCLLCSSSWALRPRTAVGGVRGGADVVDDDDDAKDDDALFGAEGQQSISDLLGGLSGVPGMNGLEPKNMEEYQAMMESFMDSPIMREFLADPEKMEMSRQALLNNPMAMQIMKSMPGLEDILYDKEKWREKMLQSKAQYEAMKKAKLDNAEPADDFDD